MRSARRRPEVCVMQNDKKRRKNKKKISSTDHKHPNDVTKTMCVNIKRSRNTLARRKNVINRTFSTECCCINLFSVDLDMLSPKWPSKLRVKGHSKNDLWWVRNRSVFCFLSHLWAETQTESARYQFIGIFADESGFGTCWARDELIRGPG